MAASQLYRGHGALTRPGSPAGQHFTNPIVLVIAVLIGFKVVVLVKITQHKKCKCQRDSNTTKTLGQSFFVTATPAWRDRKWNTRWGWSPRTLWVPLIESFDLLFSFYLNKVAFFPLSTPMLNAAPELSKITAKEAENHFVLGNKATASTANFLTKIHDECPDSYCTRGRRATVTIT